MNSIDFFTLLKREFIGIDYILESCFVPNFYDLCRICSDKFYSSIHFFRLYNDIESGSNAYYLSESTCNTYSIIYWNTLKKNTPPVVLWNHKYLMDAVLRLHIVLNSLQIKYMAS